MAPPRPREDQQTQPVRGVEGAPPAEVGAGRRPLGEGGRLGEPVPPGRLQGLRDVAGDGVRLLFDRRREGEHGPVVRRRVALPGAQCGAQPLLRVGAGLRVPAGTQFGVGEVLQRPGLQRLGPELPDGGQGPGAGAAGRVHVAEQQRGRRRPQQRVGPVLGPAPLHHLPERCTGPVEPPFEQRPHADAVVVHDGRHGGGPVRPPERGRAPGAGSRFRGERGQTRGQVARGPGGVGGGQSGGRGLGGRGLGQQGGRQRQGLMGVADRAVPEFHEPAHQLGPSPYGGGCGAVPGRGQQRPGLFGPPREQGLLGRGGVPLRPSRRVGGQFGGAGVRRRAQPVRGRRRAVGRHRREPVRPGGVPRRTAQGPGPVQQSREPVAAALQHLGQRPVHGAAPVRRADGVHRAAHQRAVEAEPVAGPGELRGQRFRTRAGFPCRPQAPQRVTDEAGVDVRPVRGPYGRRHRQEHVTRPGGRGGLSAARDLDEGRGVGRRTGQGAVSAQLRR